MALFYAPDGTLWPVGSLVRTVSTDADLAFEAGTLPSWLTRGTTGADAGSSDAVSTADPGGIAITTAASTNATATLYGPAIDLGAVRRVRLDVCFTGGVATNRRIDVGVTGATSGGYFKQVGASSYGALHAISDAGASTLESVAYQVRDDSVIKRFAVFVIVDPFDGTVAVGEGDQVFAHHAFGAAAMGTTGTATPLIRVTTLDTTARTLDVHQVTIRREWL
jgi:hypothetical protein